MPNIKVLVQTINKETFQKILDFYNSNKEEGEASLKLLDRAEGGFKIELPEKEWEKDDRGFIDANKKYRQERWCKGRLISSGHKGFTEKQYMLLYEALVFSLEPGTVILEE
jgi:hypothetical protein